MFSCPYVGAIADCSKCKKMCYFDFYSNLEQTSYDECVENDQQEEIEFEESLSLAA